jgi:hypothetical protein
LLAFAAAVCAAGAAGLLSADRLASPGWPRAASRALAGVFALLGAAGAMRLLYGRARPARVRHAARDVLPLVPREPVVAESTIVQGRLRHELVVGAHAAELRPARRAQLADRLLLYGFGGPFLLGFAALLSWVFHSRMHLFGWPLAIVTGVTLTLLGGLPCFFVIGRLMLGTHRQLARLTAPLNGDALTLEAPPPPDLGSGDPAAGLRWLFGGPEERTRETIPRRAVVAVQLCPWKHVSGGAGERSVTWAAQGLLVLADANRSGYRRLPLLATGDFAGAARLMGRLAHALRVPFLFDADAQGWRDEAARAKSRSPLRAGGYVS